MSEYDIQAAEFLKKANARMTISRTGEVEYPWESGLRMWHYKYQVTLTRDKKQYRFTFYDSFHNWQNNKRPTRYSVLASIEKYPAPETVEEFAAEFGYKIESDQERRKVERIRKKCEEQYNRLLDMFGEDLMKELREIW